VAFSLTNDYMVLQDNELYLGDIAAGDYITPANGILLEVS